MYTLKLALIVLCCATAAYAYPAAASSPESLARIEHTISPPHTTMPYAVTNTAERDPHGRYMPRAMQDAAAAAIAPDAQKRQIHNADYHANAPPTSPNPAPAPAPAPEPVPSPASANPPAAAASEPVAKDKRATFKHGPGPMIPSSPSVAAGKEQSDTGKNRFTTIRRAMDTNLLPRFPKIAFEWSGWSRRNVEALTNNPNYHSAVTHWSRGEVEKMKAWSKLY